MTTVFKLRPTKGLRISQLPARLRTHVVGFMATASNDAAAKGAKQVTGGVSV